MFEQAFKNIDDVRWKEAGCAASPDYTEQTSWLLIVKYLGDIASFAWVQHFIHHSSPSGFAGFVLANGSVSSNQSGEGEIRKATIDANLVDCMVALPGQHFWHRKGTLIDRVHREQRNRVARLNYA
jgi:hypothetical protein